jgi:hypothetical protein
LDWGERDFEQERSRIIDLAGMDQPPRHLPRNRDTLKVPKGWIPSSGWQHREVPSEMRVLFGVHPLIRPLKVSVPALQQSLPVIWGVLAVGVFLIWRSGAYFEGRD